MNAHTLSHCTTQVNVGKHTLFCLLAHRPGSECDVGSAGGAHRMQRRTSGAVRVGHASR